MTERLRHVGFFRELEAGPEDGPSLREAVRETGRPDEDRLVDYLSSATVLATTGESVADVLRGDADRIAPMDICTDGTWVWFADLPYYLKNYHVELPEQLWEHARLADWKAPVLSEAELTEAVERFL